MADTAAIVKAPTVSAVVLRFIICPLFERRNSSSGEVPRISRNSRGELSITLVRLEILLIGVSAVCGEHGLCKLRVESSLAATKSTWRSRAWPYATSARLQPGVGAVGEASAVPIGNRAAAWQAAPPYLISIISFSLDWT